VPKVPKVPALFGFGQNQTWKKHSFYSDLFGTKAYLPWNFWNIWNNIRNHILSWLQPKH